jgi:hypothetical protein
MGFRRDDFDGHTGFLVQRYRRSNHLAAGLAG